MTYAERKKVIERVCRANECSTCPLSTSSETRCLRDDFYEGHWVYSKDIILLQANP